MTISDGGAKWKDGTVQESAPLSLDSKVRLLRHGVIRYTYVCHQSYWYGYTVDQGSLELHVTLENSKETILYHLQTHTTIVINVLHLIDKNSAQHHDCTTFFQQSFFLQML